MLKQSLQQKLQQKLTPQQIQLMKLIQLPTIEFEQRVRTELEENPALVRAGDEEEEDELQSAENGYENSTEAQSDSREDTSSSEQDAYDDDLDLSKYLTQDDTPDYKLRTHNYSPDEEEYQIPLAVNQSFREYLISQLAPFQLDDKQMKIAEYIIGSLDDAGYLRRDIADISDDLAFNEALLTDEREIEKILKEVIWLLDPPGVGARDLRESLLIQLKRKKPNPARELAVKILERDFNALTHKHYDKILHKYKIGEEQLKEALEEIRKLNPKPGGSLSNVRITTHIVPDFKVRIEETPEGEKKPVVELNARNLPELRISRHYREMLEGFRLEKNKTPSQKEAIAFIKQKLDSANWFIDAVKQRYNTLLKTMEAIVDYQKDYFLTGDERKIKPMILKDIANRVNLDISTVSRVANSKYVDTPYGTKLLKEFFSESLTDVHGREVSTIKIKEILKEIIENEDKKKPYTDDGLVKELAKHGIKVARRTIAKYRDQLNIPPARLRKAI
ncbi:MAG: RNA polymerase factor sigma-54 [Chlorobi bacterium]|nr:RNA polymerase factor sigma-54 [Chlorobiota bacterium]